MKGHIRKRGKNSWALVVDIGRDAEGKRRRKWHSFRGGRRAGRVEMWRGGSRSGLSVAASFGWRCLNSRTLTPFPHPPGRRRQSPASGSHRTPHADFQHGALQELFHNTA